MVSSAPDKPEAEAQPQPPPPPPQQPAVLYVDHTGYPSPLSYTYHPTASRHLSSGDTEASPPIPAISYEVDAAYCPQCLSYHDAYTSNTTLRGYCGRSTCKLCPLCQCPLGLTTTEQVQEEEGKEEKNKLVCMYKCGYCQWTSDTCGLIVRDVESCKGEDLLKASEALGRLHVELLLNNNDNKEGSGSSSSSHDAFRDLCNGWNQKVQDEKLKRRLGNKDISAATMAALRISSSGGVAGGSSSTTTPPPSSSSTMQVWNIQTLEEHRKKQLEYYRAMETGCIIKNVVDDEDVVVVADDDEETPPQSTTTDRAMTTTTVLTINQCVSQGINYPQRPPPHTMTSPSSIINVPSSSSPAHQSSLSSSLLLPLPIPLKARKSKRCKYELSKGKPGILVKPKNNPLEGDTSLRSGHGQWWKKDCSAVHVVPKITIVRHGQMEKGAAAGGLTALLLKVHNPTLGIVRFRLATSATAPASVGNGLKFEAQKKKNDAFLRRLRLHPYNDQWGDVQLLMDAPSSSSSGNMEEGGCRPSEWIELEAVQDALLEMSHKSKPGAPAGTATTSASTPREIVSNWSPSEAADAYLSSSEETNEFVGVRSFRLVTQEDDTAWMEVILSSPLSSSDTDAGLGKSRKSPDDADGASSLYWGLSLALQVEVGNGSWEASLVTPEEPTAGEGVDYCSFHLVLAWPSEDLTKVAGEYYYY